jgi:hypothetical protein
MLTAALVVWAMIFGTFLFVVWADQNDDFWNR